MNIKEHFVGDGRLHRAKIKSKSGKFTFSIIAGEFAYSEPRTFVPDKDYEEVEIAVFDENEAWATREQVKCLFPIIGEGEYVNGDGHNIFPYVPIELVEQAINAL